MGDCGEFDDDLAQLARLALSERDDDVRLFVARLVRKYRNDNPELAGKMESFLKSKPARAHSALRKVKQSDAEQRPMPVDNESRLSLLKVFEDAPNQEPPLMSESLEDSLNQVIQERRQADKLVAMGLVPTRSAVFVGPPGVGKTLTARWLASQLGVPLYVLDLAAVMSSFLGRSGSNLRAAIDYAKRTPCVLLLDEIDAVAKRRSDDSDVGELKRLVTVMLQEVDEWRASSLLIAATNHPELIDPALWRRFDLVIDFGMPDENSLSEAIRRFFGADYPLFEKWSETLAYAFKGQSFSDIERSIHRFRRALALGLARDDELVNEFVKDRVSDLSHKERIALASQLAAHSKLSQHAISSLTGVTRDTIRKHAKTHRGEQGGTST